MTGRCLMYDHWEDQGPGDDTSKCHPERNVSYALSPHILFCGDNQYIILSLSTSFNYFLWQKKVRHLILQ
jgi:hypothetical protein